MALVLRRIKALAQTVTTPGTAVGLTTGTVWARGLSFMAKKATGNNTGAVYVGDSSVDAVTNQQMQMNPLDFYEPDIPEDVCVDLKDLYVDAGNSGDGVIAHYIKA